MLLNNPLSIGDLLANGSHFEINSEFNEGVYDEDDEFNDLFSTDPTEEENKNEILKTPWEKSFEELKTTMVEVEHGIFKTIVSKGFGDIVPEHSRVMIHYSAFWEGEEEAFDSTYIRNKPHRFKIGNEEVLLGIEAAVQTMKKGEESQFIIPFNLLFGKMGCPPRIKPAADGLFIITLMDFSVIGDENALEKLPPEEQNKFIHVFESLKKIRASAVDQFVRGNTRKACYQFQSIISALEMCQLKDESETKLHKNELIAIYTNLAVCYNKLNQPGRTCLMCNRIALLTNINKNCKALFQQGRALVMLGDYKQAQRKLQTALNLEPNNEAIQKEIRLLAEKYEKYCHDSKEISTRAFGLMKLQEENENEESESATFSISSDFKDAIHEMFVEFSKQNQNFFSIADDLSKHELKYVETEAKKYNMTLHLAEKHDRKDYILRKNEK